MPELPVFGVADFVAVLNQTMELTVPVVDIVGELANFQIRKNQWVYFDLKDEEATVRFFGMVHQLPGPLEDGLMLQVRARPRLHPRFGFSLNVETIQAVGKGSIKRAQALLEAKLRAEGLFELARKRLVPYPPHRIGLIAATQSAGYADFIKILNQRWGNSEVVHINVAVQGADAPAELVLALQQLNALTNLPDVIVVTRGGGSADDLAAFSTEQVVRAVASSRVPTLVAIGHEIDESLAELAADVRASTPSNAAELLVPDRTHEKSRLGQQQRRLAAVLQSGLAQARQQLLLKSDGLRRAIVQLFELKRHELAAKREILIAYNPRAILKRGYALLRKNGQLVRSGTSLSAGDVVETELADATALAVIKKVSLQ